MRKNPEPLRPWTDTKHVWASTTMFHAKSRTDWIQNMSGPPGMWDRSPTCFLISLSNLKHSNDSTATYIEMTSVILLDWDGHVVPVCTYIPSGFTRSRLRTPPCRWLGSRQGQIELSDSRFKTRKKSASHFTGSNWGQSKPYAKSTKKLSASQHEISFLPNPKVPPALLILQWILSRTGFYFKLVFGLWNNIM